MLNNPATGGTYSVLSEVGLSMQKDGTMSLDSSDLKAALQSDFDGVNGVRAGGGRHTRHTCKGRPHVITFLC